MAVEIVKMEDGMHDGKLIVIAFVFRGCIYSSLIKMFYCSHAAFSNPFYFAISTMLFDTKST